MTSVIETAEGDIVTVVTTQFGNGLSVECRPETDKPQAAFGIDEDYHADLRREILSEGGRIVGGEKLQDETLNPYKLKMKKK